MRPVRGSDRCYSGTRTLTTRTPAGIAVPYTRKLTAAPGPSCGQRLLKLPRPTARGCRGPGASTSVITSVPAPIKRGRGSAPRRRPAPGGRDRWAPGRAARRAQNSRRPARRLRPSAPIASSADCVGGSGRRRHGSVRCAPRAPQDAPLSCTRKARCRSVAHHIQRDRLARGVLADDTLQRAHAIHGATVGRDDHVARLPTRPVRPGCQLEPPSPRTITPAIRGSPATCASAALTSSIMTPSIGARTRPCLIRSSITERASEIGTAKP